MCTITLNVVISRGWCILFIVLVSPGSPNWFIGLPSIIFEHDLIQLRKYTWDIYIWSSVWWGISNRDFIEWVCTRKSGVFDNSCNHWYVCCYKYYMIRVIKCLLCFQIPACISAESIDQIIINTICVFRLNIFCLIYKLLIELLDDESKTV